MRIISGKFKGRKINFISNSSLRPTSDMIRQAFFTKFQFDISNSRFLDLFSGSGAIGLEALSKGAKEVCFVEKNKENYKIIEKNIITLYGENYTSEAKNKNQIIHLIHSDFMFFLNSVKDNTTFDFVYIDPPYQSDYYKISLEKLLTKKLLTSESVVICEHNNTIDINTAIPKQYDIVSQKKYGSKSLTYLKLN